MKYTDTAVIQVHYNTFTQVRLKYTDTEVIQVHYNTLTQVCLKYRHRGNTGTHEIHRHSGNTGTLQYPHAGMPKIQTQR